MSQKISPRGKQLVAIETVNSLPGSRLSPEGIFTGSRRRMNPTVSSSFTTAPVLSMGRETANVMCGLGGAGDGMLRSSGFAEPDEQGGSDDSGPIIGAG